MSRFNDFTNFEEGRVDDIASLLSDNGKTFDVLRRDDSSGAGFNQERGDLAVVSRILALVSSTTTNPAVVGTSDIRTSQSEYLFTTNYRLRIGDILRSVDGSRFKIRSINGILDNIYQATGVQEL